MLTIKLATSAETDQVVAILVEASRWLQSRNILSWKPDVLPAQMQAAVARGEVYLAWKDGQAIGTVTVMWSDVAYWGERPDDAGYIHKVAVRRAAAGQNVGAQMVSWAEQLILERRRPFARLDCQADNPTINQFYQSAGYELRGSIDTPIFPLNLYEKRLHAPITS